MVVGVVGNAVDAAVAGVVAPADATVVDVDVAANVDAAVDVDAVVDVARPR